MQRVLGPERFRLCLQLYSYFEDIFKVATGDIKYDLQHVVNTGNHITDKRIVQLMVEVSDIKRRIKNVEKHMSKRSETTLEI